MDDETGFRFASLHWRRSRAPTLEAPTQTTLRRLGSLPGIRAAALLATCHRIEAYLHVDPDEFSTDTVGRSMGIAEAPRVRQGADAARHLFRVAAGLDSPLRGEHEILGQVRAALRAAHEAGTLAPPLSRLFQASLEHARRIRRQWPQRIQSSSLGGAAVRRLAHLAGPLEGRRILIVGSGHAAASVGASLRRVRDVRIHVLGRTRVSAERLGAKLQATSGTLAELQAELADADAALIALRTNGTRIAIEAHPKLAAVVDISYPSAAAVPPSIRSAGLWDVVDAAAPRLAPSAPRVRQAEEFLARAANQFVQREEASHSLSGHVLRRLRFRARGKTQEQVARALARLGPLSARDRAVISSLAQSIEQRLLEEPTRVLADPATPTATAKTIADLFEIDVADRTPERLTSATVEAPTWPS